MGDGTAYQCRKCGKIYKPIFGEHFGEPAECNCGAKDFRTITIAV